MGHIFLHGSHILPSRSPARWSLRSPSYPDPVDCSSLDMRKMLEEALWSWFQLGPRAVHQKTVRHVFSRLLNTDKLVSCLKIFPKRPVLPYLFNREWYERSIQYHHVIPCHINSYHIISLLLVAWSEVDGHRHRTCAVESEGDGQRRSLHRGGVSGRMIRCSPSQGKSSRIYGNVHEISRIFMGFLGEII